MERGLTVYVSSLALYGAGRSRNTLLSHFEVNVERAKGEGENIGSKLNANRPLAPRSALSFEAALFFTERIAEY